MRRRIGWALALLLALIWNAAAMAPSGAAPAPLDTWKRARALADERHYDEALAVLRDGLTRDPRNTDLLWLEAGIYGEAGRHKESVARYLILVSTHPELARDVRKDLATERLWADDPAGALRDFDLRIEEDPADRDARRLRALALAYLGRHSEALAAYDRLLAERPDDDASALGCARVLAWMGRHAQASAAYEDYLRRHPGDPEARMALAQNVNWSGDHRQAARMYQALRQEGSRDPEVSKGLAFAEYWAGRPERARIALDTFLIARPEDREGLALAQRLARERRPSLTAGYQRSDDTDALRIETRSVEYRQPLGSRTAATLSWRGDHVRDQGGNRDPYQLRAQIERRWSDAWSTQLAGGYLKPDGEEPGLGVGEANLTFRPADRWRIDGGWARDQILTRRSLELGIMVDVLTLGADWNATSRVMLHADGRLRAYNDDNQQALGAAWIRTILQSSRTSEFGVGFRIEHLASDHDLDHGYYDPAFYREIGPSADIEWRPQEGVSFGLEGKLGLQKENGASEQTFHNLVANAEIPLGAAVLHLVGARTNSNLSSASGFRQRRWAAYLSAGF